MDDVKDKVKGFMKKVNNPFSSSSSSKFKGQGHVLGSSSSTPPPTLPVHRRAAAAPPRKPSPSATPPISNNVSDPAGDIEKLVFECPVCARSFPSEAQVSAHVDSCLSEGKASEVETRVGEYVRGMPRKEAVEVVVRLLGNVAREPENEKFRRIRMGNPKIKEAVGDAKGGLELLECVGFRVEQEGDEVWAKMEEVPGEEGIGVIKEALSLLERWKLDDDSSKMAALNVAAKAQNEQEKIDRQVN